LDQSRFLPSNQGLILPERNSGLIKGKLRIFNQAPAELLPSLGNLGKSPKRDLAPIGPKGLKGLFGISLRGPPNLGEKKAFFLTPLKGVKFFSPKEMVTQGNNEIFPFLGKKKIGLEKFGFPNPRGPN